MEEELNPFSIQVRVSEAAGSHQYKIYHTTVPLYSPEPRIPCIVDRKPRLLWYHNTQIQDKYLHYTYCFRKSKLYFYLKILQETYQSKSISLKKISFDGRIGFANEGDFIGIFSYDIQFLPCFVKKTVLLIITLYYKCEILRKCVRINGFG